MKLHIIKDKQSGYVLLLVMLLVSSLFLLVMSVITKNRLGNSLAHTISIKHEQNLLLSSAIGIIQSLLYNNTNYKKTDGEEPINQKSETNIEKKEYTEKEKKELIASYFRFYWQYCNKWLEYPLEYEKQKLEGNISIYLMVEDGKLALQKFYLEYDIALKKEKRGKNEKSQTNEQNNNENQSIHDKKSNDEKEKSKNEEHENRTTITDEKIENIAFLKTIKEKFEKLEEKNLILKNLFQTKNEQKAFESIIVRLLKMNTPEEINSIYPLSLFDASRGKINEKKIFGDLINKQEKEHSETYAFSHFYSLENKITSLLYLSPAILELLSGKKIDINGDTRKQIIEESTTFFKNGDTATTEKIWNAFFAKITKTSYQKDFFDNNEIKKIFSTQLEIPDFFSAIIKIDILKNSFFAYVVFEKNVFLNEDNAHYFVKSIYIIPNE